MAVQTEQRPELPYISREVKNMRLDKLYANAVIVSAEGRNRGCLGVKKGKVAVIAGPDAGPALTR